MNIRFEDPNLRNVLSVVQRMRIEDWREVTNSLPRSMAEVDAIAMHIVQRGGVGWVLLKDDVPAVVCTMAPIHEGAFYANMIATDDFATVWRHAVRAMHEITIPALLGLDAQWCEARVAADNEPAQQLLAFLGWSPKSEVMTGWGSFGKDFILYGISRGEFDNVCERPKPIG